METVDFELRISAGIGRAYPVSVINSPGGVVQETMHFPYDEQGLRRLVQELRLAVQKSGSDGHSPERAMVEGFGRLLFSELIKGEIKSLYRASQEEAQAQGQELRIKLHIEPHELSAVPWDFLYDDELAQFVALVKAAPNVRAIEMAEPDKPLPKTGPLRESRLGARSSAVPSADTAPDIQPVEKAQQTREIRA